MIAHDYVKAGAIGDVKEVHTWTGVHEDWFSDGIRTPEGSDPVPDSLNWYDGVNAPPRMPGLEDGRKMEDAGSYLVGTKGTCWVIGSHNDSAVLVPETARKNFGSVKSEQATPPSRGHEKEFLMAARGEIAYNAPLSHFGYGGKLTAVALMANIAARVKGELRFDAKTQRFTNSDEANKLMTRKPRAGWDAA